MAVRHQTVECGGASHRSRQFFSTADDEQTRYRRLDEQRERIDDLLSSLLDNGDDDDEDGFLDLSPEGIEKERNRWIIYDEMHAHLFVLWSNMSGMGGESLSNLWMLAEKPGSAALFRDFAVLSARKKRLEKRKEFRERKRK